MSINSINHDENKLAETRDMKQYNNIRNWTKRPWEQQCLKNKHDSISGLKQGPYKTLETIKNTQNNHFDFEKSLNKPFFNFWPHSQTVDFYNRFITILQVPSPNQQIQTNQKHP